MDPQPKRPKRKRHPKVTEEEKLTRERFIAWHDSMRGDNPPQTYRQLQLRAHRARKQFEEEKRLDEIARAAGMRFSRVPWSELDENRRSTWVLYFKTRWKEFSQKDRDAAMRELPEAVVAAGKWPKESDKRANSKHKN